MNIDKPTHVLLTSNSLIVQQTNLFERKKIHYRLGYVRLRVCIPKVSIPFSLTYLIGFKNENIFLHQKDFKSGGHILNRPRTQRCAQRFKLGERERGGFAHPP